MRRFWHSIATAKASLAAYAKITGRKNRGKLRRIYTLPRGISETADLVDCVVRDAVRSEPVCCGKSLHNSDSTGKTGLNRLALALE